MRKSQSWVADPLSATIAELCREYGVWNTARALIAAVWRRHRERNDVSHLSNRMRRDVGLPEIEDAPGERRLSYWGIRIHPQ
nr:DUF1127 domain-containing protein [Rhizobium terrae]